MKRIKAACLTQTIHFQLRDNLPHDAAVQAVQMEYEQYKRTMDHNGTRYRLLREEPQSDGSLIIEVKRQYNNQSCGSYLD